MTTQYGLLAKRPFTIRKLSSKAFLKLPLDLFEFYVKVISHQPMSMDEIRAAAQDHPEYVELIT